MESNWGSLTELLSWPWKGNLVKGDMTEDEALILTSTASLPLQNAPPVQDWKGSGEHGKSHIIFNFPDMSWTKRIPHQQPTFGIFLEAETTGMYGNRSLLPHHSEESGNGSVHSPGSGLSPWSCQWSLHPLWWAWFCYSIFHSTESAGSVSPPAQFQTPTAHPGSRRAAIN